MLVVCDVEDGAVELGANGAASSLFGGSAMAVAARSSPITCSVKACDARFVWLLVGLSYAIAGVVRYIVIIDMSLRTCPSTRTKFDGIFASVSAVTGNVNYIIACRVRHIEFGLYGPLCEITGYRG